MTCRNIGRSAFLATAASVLMLSGCASINYVMEHYGSVPVQEVHTQYDTFRVFDKPSEGRLMITSSLASAAGQGFVGGLALNPTIAAAPKPVFQEATEKFLRETGRDCRVADGYLLIHPQWEFKYECEPQITTSALR